MFEIIRDVLFPILSHSAADEQLWNTDPYEYIRVKFGKINDNISANNIELNIENYDTYKFDFRYF